ncbi:P-loop containing nucleoside triphosphate hydrolase protein [Leucosporidium creatinivorum]|uniref:p-loop containing nucleoside triphosphate hydrolase protein n=1 Tax=Leucosporidium creatinivorum TaxID=106004 RepID=A0A1Y2G1T9_9BASI|nr:P-loop containing nucleoside triphosphate hydrolase protein [Leucosporidium creatinivorum]
MDDMPELRDVEGSPGVKEMGSQALLTLTTGLTEAELAFATLEQLPLRPNLPPTTLRDLQSTALAQLAASPTSGSDLLRKALQSEATSSQSNRRRYSTTLDELDELLDGGWEAGEVVEVAGGRQSGRSSLVLYTLLHHLLTHPNNRAVFIHTSPTFDASRCRSILHILIENERSNGVQIESEDSRNLSTDELAVRTLGRLAVLHPFSPSQALEGLVAETEIKEERPEKLSMVVVDSVETLLGGEPLSNPSPEGHATLVSFARQVKLLARTHALAVFLLNAASTSSTAVVPPITSLPLQQPNVKPTLGVTFTYLTDLTIWTTRAESIWGSDGRGKFIAEVARNRRGEARGWIGFDLSDGLTLRAVD